VLTFARATARSSSIVLLALTCLVGCNDEELGRRLGGEVPCRDTAVLLNTSTGPLTMTCNHRRHHMRVQAVSTPSNEDFGAIVLCECDRDTAPLDAGLGVDGAP
jgi:hypothetical protein